MSASPLLVLAEQLGYFRPGQDVKTVISLELCTESPLHVGTGAAPGEEHRSSIITIPVLEQGRVHILPVIPESEIKGALRSTCEMYLLGYLDEIVREALSRLANKLVVGGELLSTVWRQCCDVLGISYENLIRDLARVVKYTHTQYGHRLIEEILSRLFESLHPVYRTVVEREVQPQEVVELFAHVEQYGAVLEQLLRSEEARRARILLPLVVLSARLIQSSYGRLLEQEDFRGDLRIDVISIEEALRDLAVASVELLCPICRMFGGSKISDRLVITTFIPDESTCSLRCVTRTSISRYTGTAEEARLFSVMFVEPGTVYRGKIVLELDVDYVLKHGNPDEEPWILLDRPVVDLLVNRLIAEGKELVIGGLRSVGFGILRIRSATRETLRLSFEHGLRAS